MFSHRVLWFKKIYFPGLISLVCLPLFCLTKIAYPRYFEKLTLIHVAWLNDKEYNTDIFKSFRTHFPKKFEDDSLTSDKKHNDNVFSNLRKKAVYYESTEDTSSAYRITFTNKARYEDVIDVLDILQALRRESLNYIWLNNKIEIYKIIPHPEAKTTGTLDRDVFFCGTGYGNNSYIEPVPFFSYKNLDTLVKSAKEFIREFWAPLIFLLLMLISAIVSRRKYVDNLR